VPWTSITLVSEVNLTTYQAAGQEKQRSILSSCLERDTLLFAAQLALVVGTILGLINHGQALFTGHLTIDQLVPMLVTYCVPFCVSMFSQVQGKRERDRLYAEVIAATKQSEANETSNE
jgi:hypothetical protein